jgi:translation initiation factor IF-1
MTASADDGAAGVHLGVVVAALPHHLWRVRLESHLAHGGTVVTAGIGPALRVLALRMRPGDRVRVELAPADPTRATIVAREGGDARGGRG